MRDLLLGLGCSFLVCLAWPATAIAQHRVGYAYCGEDKPKDLRVPYVAVFSSARLDRRVAKLKCGSPVLVLREDGKLARVRHKGKEGYAYASLIFPYPLELKVLQADSLPYAESIGGGQANVDCSIKGTIDTRGRIWSTGPSATWRAYSYPDLRLSCTSYETPPIEWNHVLNMALAVASDGNAYILACDAAWRWSKCRTLMPDIYPAYWTDRGLRVVYVTGKKELKQATYRVLSTKSLGSFGR